MIEWAVTAVIVVSPYEMPHQVLRLVDASMNRVGEGLRLLEDVARLLLDDAVLTGRLRAMRHELLTSDASLQLELVGARDAAGDVGVDTQAAPGDRLRDLTLTVIANARRVQESLRSLEELAKLPEAGGRLDSDRFKHARFSLYALEQELLGRLTRRDRSKRIRGLYVIIDTVFIGGRTHAQVTVQALRGGAGVIQLRDKTTGRAELLEIARGLKALCHEHGALFVMNDYLDIAVATGADGLHLGQGDLPLGEARRLVPLDMLLGTSCTSVELAAAAEAQGADYIAVGSMYPTLSKETAVVVGPEMLQKVRQKTSRPLVAIGGINRGNVGEVVRAGADSICVISAVLGSDNPEEAARQLVVALEESSG